MGFHLGVIFEYLNSLNSWYDMISMHIDYVVLVVCYGRILYCQQIWYYTVLILKTSHLNYKFQLEAHFKLTDGELEIKCIRRPPQGMNWRLKFSSSQALGKCSVH